MKVYKVELMVIDFDNIQDDIKDVIENTKYANRCINPMVMNMESVEIEWSDEHPLNKRVSIKEEFERLFSHVKK